MFSFVIKLSTIAYTIPAEPKEDIICNGFKISDEVFEVIVSGSDIWDKFHRVVSKERVYEELLKMFRFNTIETLDLLNKLKEESNFPIVETIFKDGLWMKPTFEKVN